MMRPEGGMAMDEDNLEFAEGEIRKFCKAWPERRRLLKLEIENPNTDEVTRSWCRMSVRMGNAICMQLTPE